MTDPRASPESCRLPRETHPWLDENGAGVADWLGEEYANLPHISLESQQLNVGAKDFIVIPEVFSNVMEQCKNFPSKRILRNGMILMI